jgi:hypothetical protein
MPWEWGAFEYAILGGVLAELVGLARLRYEHPKNWPEYYRWSSFYILTAIFVFVGGVVALVFDAQQALSPMLALNVGASWPLILERLFRSTSGYTLGEVD